jgi:magnesium-transporting ATPase (P-type)
MNQQLSSPKSPVVSDFRNTVKKVIKWLLIIIVVLGISMFYWKYFYTYSEGYFQNL